MKKKINKYIILIVILSFHTISTYTQTVRVIDNKGTLKNVDASVANELQDLVLNTTTNILTISGLNAPTQIDLTPYLDNTDNQQITAFTFNASSNILTLTLENGGTQTVNLSSLIGDGNITSDDLTVAGDTNALLADVTLEIAAGKVGTTELADDAVTTSKLVDANITTTKLANDAITTIKVADEAINSAKIATGTIIANNIANGTITTDKFAAGAANEVLVTNASGDVEWAELEATNIATENVNSTDGSITGVANNAVLAAMDLEVNVDNTSIETNATNGVQVKDGGIATAKIADDAVTNAKLANNAVNTQNITDGTILLEDLGQNGAADGETIVWNNTNSQWSTSKIFIPKIAERYDAVGGQTITHTAGNFQTTANLGVEIQFNTSAILDTDEYSSSNTTITVKKAGVYKVTYRVTAELGGTTNNRSGSEYKLTKTTGGTETVIPGTYAAAYHRNRSVDRNTATVTRFVTLAANDILKVRGNKYEPSNTNVSQILETSANGSSFTIEKIR